TNGSRYRQSSIGDSVLREDACGGQTRRADKTRKPDSGGVRKVLRILSGGGDHHVLQPGPLWRRGAGSGRDPAHYRVVGRVETRRSQEETSLLATTFFISYVSRMLNKACVRLRQ